MLVCLMPLVGAGAWIVGKTVEAYRADFEDHLLDSARALALAVGNEVETHVAAATALASSPLAARDDTTEFRAWAAEVARSLDTWVVLSSLEPGLPQLVNTLLPAEVQPPQGGPAEAIARMLATGRPVMSDLFGGHASRRPIASVVVPVPAGDGPPRRAVGVILDPSRLARLLEDEGVRGGIAAVADGSGRVIARSRDHDRFVGAQAPSWFAMAAGAQHGLFRGENLEGTPALFGFHRVRPEPRWAVVVSTPLATYEWSWKGPLLQLASAVLVALLAGLACARWLGQRLLAPVSGLLVHARAVAASAGDGAAPPPVPPAAVAEFEELRQAIAHSDLVLRRRAEAERQAAAAAAESEARFRGMADGAPVLIWMADPDGRRTWFNRPWLAFRGRRDEEERLDGWAAGIHPEDAARRARLEAEHLARREPYSLEYRLLRHDGAWRWMLETAVPRHGADGGFLGFIGSCIDITERRLAEERHLLLLREVDHRAKNVLAVVQSIIRLAPPDDPKRYAAVMEARVMALSRAHVLLAERGWESAGLREVAEAGLPRSAASPGRVGMSGPDLALKPQVVQPLALVVHELAVAAPMGDAGPDGPDAVLTWRLDAEADLLILEWRALRPADGDRSAGIDGFAERLVQALVTAQLRGRIDRTPGAEAGGIRIALPASRSLAASPAGKDQACPVGQLDRPEA
jgi:PAS domain S-box-containing protein